MTKHLRASCSVIVASVTLLVITSIASAQGYKELAAVGVDLFGVVSDDSVEHRSADLGRLESLGGTASEITALALTDGRYEVFMVDQNDSLWRSRQEPDSYAWSDWEQLDNASKHISVARAASGRIVLFVIDSEGALWNLGRDSDDSGFDRWERFGFAGTQLSAAAADGGGFEVAIVGLDNTVQHLRFDDAGEQSGEAENLGGEASDVALAPLPGGGHSLIIVGASNELSERRRVDEARGWSDWQSLGRSATRVALTRVDDELQLFSLDSSGAVSRARLTAADASWSEPEPISDAAAPLTSRLEGRARLIIPSLDVDKDVPVSIDLHFNADRSQVEITAFPSVVTEPFDTPFGETTSTVSLAQSSTGELLSDQGILRLPVTLHFDQSLDLPIIQEDGDLSLTLSSDAEGGRLLDASSGDVSLSGSGRFDGVGSTNPLDGQTAQIIVSGKLKPTP